MMRHTLLASALILTAAAAVGCSDANFKSVNDSFTAVKTSSGALQNANLAAGAIASNMAAMQVLDAIASQASGVISAGGGNVIAPGGGNYFLLDTNAGTGETESDDKDQKGNPNVKVKYTYSIQSEASGLQHWVLSEVAGMAYGYEIKVAGKYDFTPDLAATKSTKLAAGHAAGSLTGQLALDGKVVQKLTKLSFETDSPLPATIEKLGELALENIGTDTRIDIVVSRKDKVFGVKGSVYEKNELTATMEADQNNIQKPTFTKVSK
jgi:hypothetical protein